MNEQDLRDCFAMFAMMALINDCGVGDEDNCAVLAYKQADAMLKARKPEIEEGIVAIKKRVRKS
jgi:hypothetical protein